MSKKLKFDVSGYHEDGTGGGVAQDDPDPDFLLNEIRAGRAHFPECPGDGGACTCMQTLEEIGEDF